MNPTTVSLKENFMELSGPTGPSITGITFQETRDFSPHGEVYLGELPTLYSFGPDLKKFTGWIELKDGHFSLLPFLLRGPTEQRLVLTDIGGHFFENYYTSSFVYEDISLKRDLCFVHLDFYQDLSTSSHVEQSFQRLQQLAKTHEKIKLCVSMHALASRLSNNTHAFYEGLRALPDNCEIISNTDFFGTQAFQGRSVYFLTDQDFILKSPWENIFAARGAIINGIVETTQDPIALRVTIGHKVDKIVQVKKSPYRKISTELTEYLRTIFSMLKSDQDLLHVHYLRHMREALELIRKNANA